MLPNLYQAVLYNVLWVTLRGGNIDFHLLDRITERGLAQIGRLVRISILLRDIPGALARLTNSVAQHRANILHFIHERAAKDIPIGFSKVILVLETRGSDHIREIQQGFRAKGYSLQILS